MEKELNYTSMDMAIVGILRRNENGLRYNELYRRLQKEYKSVCIKTFNDHLKKLVSLKIVNKKEINKFKVNYELKINAYILDDLGIDKDNMIRVSQDMLAHVNMLIIESEALKLFSNPNKVSINDQSIKNLIENLNETLKLSLLRAIITREKDKNISNYFLDEYTTELNKSLKKIVEYSFVNEKCAAYARKETDLIGKRLYGKIQLESKSRNIN